MTSLNPLICEVCSGLVELPAQRQPEPQPQPPPRCGACGHRPDSARGPLFCLAGPSGTGKSTVAGLLLPLLRDRFVVLEQDVLWVPELRDPAGAHRAFRSTWLRLAAMIGRNGRPVLLCGTVVPPELEPLPERALFGDVHYLALTCGADVLARRLRDRPAWRAWDEPRTAEMLDYADWLRREAASMRPPVTLLDTTERSAEETAAEVCGWLRRLAG